MGIASEPSFPDDQSACRSKVKFISYKDMLLP
ncbi:MAG: hypothetical protein RJA81_364, partial [Planctomycetota bacterium]